ncbi:hypothetical protein ACIGO8_06080 [Streptomyces sp. NPDC053493]|uniref:hypothetical protein n=1 Tax=Streptomyces sp. NPDC053493 TaxID=3365705 RepID=UPI0037D7EBA7
MYAKAAVVVLDDLDLRDDPDVHGDLDVHDYLRAEAAVLTDSLIPLVNRFRTRQSADGTVPAPDAADRALLRRIREEGAAWYRRHALDGQAEALEADVDGWLAAGLDSRPRFGRSREALPVPADGETVFFLGPVPTTEAKAGTATGSTADGPAGSTADGPAGAGAGPAAVLATRLDCFFALRARAADRDGDAEPGPQAGPDGRPLVLITGSAGCAAPKGPGRAAGETDGGAATCRRGRTASV